MLDTMSWPLCWAVDECSIYIHIVPCGIRDGFCRYMYMYVSILGVMCTVTIPPLPPPPCGVVSYAQASRDLEKKQASGSTSGSIMILNYNTNVYQLWLYAMSR